MTPTKSRGGKFPRIVVAQNRLLLQALALLAAIIAIARDTKSLPFVSAFSPPLATTTTSQQQQTQRMFSVSTTGRSRTRSTFELLAGFGSPSQASGKKKKKGGKNNKTKKKGGSGETATQAKQRWANKLKRVYGGTSAEEIAAGTEKRIGTMMQESLSEPLRKALELREIVQGFERKISGMDAEDLRRRFSQEELERAIANRRAFEEHVEANSLFPEDLQVAMQRLTWDASADAKACRSVTGTMPTTFKNRVTKASEMAHEAVVSTDGGLVLDVGCGYGVLVPFLKKAGFKAHQIHGVDLSSEMIGHAMTFYPDVASKGKFETMDFLAEGGSDNSESDDNKYRAAIFCSALHDLPDLKAALLKTRNELLDNKSKGSRLVIVHAQGASHVLNQHKQNPLLVPRGLPTKAELEEWLCSGEEKIGGPVMKIVHEPAEPRSQDETREGYLAVLETI